MSPLGHLGVARGLLFILVGSCLRLPVVLEHHVLHVEGAAEEVAVRSRSRFFVRTRGPWIS